MYNPPRFDPIKNFHHGSPSGKLKHWALYEPASKRFLFTSNDQDINKLHHIRVLCSSRYNLFICDISTADNYLPDLVDNECCENWSMSDIINDATVLAMPMLKITRLVPSGSTEVSNSVIREQKNWIQFVNYWAEQISPIRIPRWQFIDSFIEKMLDTNSNSALGNDRVAESNTLINRIELELYLGSDIETTENKIIQMINEILMTHDYL